MLNRILIVGTPRTGSTNFAKEISKNRNCIRVGEIFNLQTFKKHLSRQKVDINEWERFKNDQKELEELEQMAKFQIQMFKKTDNIVAKLFPEHLNNLGNDKVFKYSFELCESADEIYYTQRLDKKAQTISKSVSLLTKHWNKDRKPFEGELTDFMLTETFKDIKEETGKVFNIFKKYPGKVINLNEKDNPYPNRYEYKGDWQEPEKLPICKC